MSTKTIQRYHRMAEHSIQLAMIGQSKLTSFHLGVEGMSSMKGRHMLNNLLGLKVWRDHAAVRTRYLEVGSWRGSTLCAATFSNDVEAVAIENFAQFNDLSFGRDRRPIRESLMSNLQISRAFSKPQFDVSVIDRDCFTVDARQLGTPFDVYLYDGEHTYDAQYKAFTHFAPALADTFIAVVDDYRNLPEDGVHQATQQAFKDLGWKVEKEWFLWDACDGTDMGRQKDGWWNGVYVAVVSKKQNTTEIINKLAAVDQSFAISAEDLAEAIKRVGITATDAKISKDQLTELITAAQKTTSRDGTVIGNALKTIFTRLQQADILARLETFGVEVCDAADEPKSAYEILTALARSYPDLSPEQRRTVAELVGGIFQNNILKVILCNLNAGGDDAAQEVQP